MTDDDRVFKALADPPRRFLLDRLYSRDGRTLITRLTVTHELEGAPKHAEQVASVLPLEQGGGGWNWILSDLKTLLETGKSLES